MLKNYFTVAWRNIRRNKVFSIINIAGLAIGIAASVLLLIVVNYQLSYEKFQKNYYHIARITTQIKYPNGVNYNTGIAIPALDALRAEFPDLQFAGINGSYGSQITVPGSNNATNKFIENEGIFFMEPEFFKMFDGYKWLSGNATSLAAPNTVVVSKAEAIKYFGNWQNAIGKTLMIDNLVTLKVTGVLDNAPANTDLPISVAVSYITLKSNGGNFGFNPDWGGVSSNHQVYALVPPNITLEALNKRLLTFGKGHYNDPTKKFNVAEPLSNMHFDTRFELFGTPVVSKTTLWTLSLIGVVIIVMACINFINLSTAQAVNRSKEMGVRKVLGSNRSNLFWQMMGETFLIVFIAVIVASAIMYFAFPYIKHVASVSISLSLLNMQTIGLLLLAGLAVTVLAGLYPAFIMSGFNPITTIKNKFTTTGSGGISLRRGLVITQFAISQILIIATIVAVTQMSFIRNADLGFNKDAVLVLTGSSDSVSLAKQASFRQQLLSLPFVQSVSFNSDMPSSSNGWSSNFAYNHLPDEKFDVFMKYGDENYFDTYGLKLIAGKAYAPSDSMKEIVINETLVKKLGIKNPNEVIGKELRLGGSNWHTISGVVADFKTTSLREEVRPLILSTMNNYYNNTAIKLRTNNLHTAQDAIEKIWNKNFPEYAYNAQFFDESISHFYEQEDQLSMLYKIFAGLAIFISCLGLYGLVSFMAVQKTKEVGIRKVLGAGSAHIVYLFSKEFTILIVLAFVIAAPVAWYISSNWLSNFAYRISLGLWIFLLSIAVSMFIVLLTVSYKALKAAHANPVKSLRSE